MQRAGTNSVVFEWELFNYLLWWFVPSSLGERRENNYKFVCVPLISTNEQPLGFTTSSLHSSFPPPLSFSLALSLSLAPILSFAVFPSISICLASCFVVRLCLSFSLPLYVRFFPYSACRCSGMKDYNISVLQLYTGTSFIRHTHTHKS